MKFLLAFNLIVWSIVLGLLNGCANAPKRIEIQCVDSPGNKRDYITGPIIIDGDNMYFYDAKQRLTKVKSQVCGVK